jgi:hypothetical protein
MVQGMRKCRRRCWTWKNRQYGYLLNQDGELRICFHGFMRIRESILTYMMMYHRTIMDFFSCESRVYYCRLGFEDL